MKVPELLKSTEVELSELHPLSEAGAKRFADIIERRWRELGHISVKAWVERSHVGTESVYLVRSNLVRGLPPLDELKQMKQNSPSILA